MNDKSEGKPIEAEVLESETSEIDKRIESFEQRTGIDTSPPVPTTTPIGMMELAISKNYTIDQIEKMMELQEKYEKREAEKSFFIDFAKFKQEDIKVISDKINKLFEGRMYPSVGHFLNTVNPFLGRHNLSSNFEIDDTENKIKVTAVIYHRDGHSLRSSLSAEPDTKGPQGTKVKTDIHGAMSTVTHLMRATFSAVTGIAAIDSKFDDDANTASGIAYIDKDQVDKISQLMEKTKINEKVFLKSLGADTVEKIPKERFKKALSTLETKEILMKKNPAKKKPIPKAKQKAESQAREPGCNDE